MKKLLTAIGAVLLVLAVQSAPPAQAAPPAGGCPSNGGWNGPTPSIFVIPTIDKGDFSDRNGDGLLCFTVPAGFCGNRGLGENAPACGAWLWKDNNN